MPNYVLDSSAASVNAAINKVVNITDQPTAGNDNVVKSGGVKTYVDNSVAAVQSDVNTFKTPNVVGANSDTATQVTYDKTWVDFPGLEVTITPRLANSSFLINGNCIIGNERAEKYMAKVVYKVNSGSFQDVITAPNLGTNRRSIHGVSDMDYDHDDWITGINVHLWGSGLSYSLSDTLTFKMQIQGTHNGSHALYFNKTQADGDNHYTPRGVSTLTVQEI